MRAVCFGEDLKSSETEEKYNVSIFQPRAEINNNYGIMQQVIATGSALHAITSGQWRSETPDWTNNEPTEDVTFLTSVVKALKYSLNTVYLFVLI